jgi:hypothetical protein
MPLLPTPDTQTLEDHFFGSGAFSFGWFDTQSQHFPAWVRHYEDEFSISPTQTKVITQEAFIEAIKKYAETQSYRTFQDLIEDMDAVDVDACIQLIFFDEIRYS